MVELKYFLKLMILSYKDGNPAHEYYIMQMNKYAHIKKLNYIS